MSSDTKVAMLKNVLTEFKKVCPEVRYSFIVTSEGDIATPDSKTEEAAKVFQPMFKEASSVGGVDSLVVDAERGKLLISPVEGFYLGIVASGNADLPHLRFVLPKIASVIFKVMDKVSGRQEVEKEEGAEDLQVSILEGFFARNVRIDGEILERWSALFEGGKIIEVEVSTPEKRVLCKVKDVENPELRGKRVIEIPKKFAKILGLEKGDLVKVVPATAIAHGEFLVNKKVAERYETE